MKTISRIWIFIVLLGVILFSTDSARARVKLASLPERGDTVIRLENTKATLIQEERVLTLQKGVNRVDFSWKGVDIDPDSIRLAILTHPEEVRLLNVSYPPAEAALVWEIASAAAWEEKVRVSYLLKSIDSLLAYKAVADKAEQYTHFKANLVLRNFSGEDFEKAKVVLGFGENFFREIAHEETQRMLLFEVEKMPLEKVWTFDAGVLPWDPEQMNTNVGIPVSYRIENKEQNGLGAFGLPPGKVRVFQQDGYGSTIFLGEDRIRYVPVGEKTGIRIGDSRDIVVTQQKMRDKRINVRRNEDNQVVLYDTDEKIHAKIENFKDASAVLTMIQHIRGQWEMVSCNMPYELEDAHTLKFEIQLAPRETKSLSMTYHRRNVRR